jgi:protease YdgD
VQSGSVHFLLGYAAGKFRAHRRVISFQTGTDRRPAERGPAGADWAILQLEAPLDLPSLPLRPARPGERIMLGGYQQDRAEVLMADLDCRILSLRQEAGTAVLLHGCAGTRGASGAPLLRREAAPQALTSPAASSKTRLVAPRRGLWRPRLLLRWIGPAASRQPGQLSPALRPWQ